MRIGYDIRPAGGDATRSNPSAVSLHPRRTVILVGAIWAGLVIMYFITQLVFVRLHWRDNRHWVKFFDLDGRANIPQTFQAIGLLAISVLLFGIAQHKKARHDSLSIYWTSLGWIFLFLTFDGMCSIHNQMHVYHAKTNDEQRKQGIFFFSWTLAYGAIMLPVGLVYLRFLRKLPRPLATAIFVAGVIYVTGALGMEMIYGWFRAHQDHVRLSTTMMLETTEESMEMLGEMLMLFALLKHIAEEKIHVGITSILDAGVQQRANIVDETPASEDISTVPVARPSSVSEAA